MEELYFIGMIFFLTELWSFVIQSVAIESVQEHFLQLTKEGLFVNFRKLSIRPRKVSYLSRFPKFPFNSAYRRL